jgi:uncharacterized protein YggE
MRNEGPLGLTVVGQGHAFVTPDRAILGFSVSSEATTAHKARSQGDEIMGGVQAAIQAAGVEDRDMNTGRYSIQPVWTQPRGATPAKIKGYIYQSKLAVVVRKLDIVPDVIDTAAKAGGNVDGINFQAAQKDTDEQENNAIDAALQDAREKADRLAAGLKIKIGPPLNVTHSINYQGGGKVIRAQSFMAENEYGGARPAVKAGDQEISMTVTVLYSILTDDD